MRIAVLSDRDGVGGDAQVAAALVKSYRASGHETLFLVGQRRTHSIACTPLYSSLRTQLAAVIPVLGRSRTVKRSLLVSEIMRRLKAFQPDAVHIHNIHQHLGGDDVLMDAVAKLWPVVWTLHDMWALTGGCTHSFDCRKFFVGCTDPCPRRGKGTVTKDLEVADEWKRKRKVFKCNGKNICLACPSLWLKSLATESVGGLVRVEHVPNGIDLSVFRPMDRISARRVLGLPLDRRILMFATRSLADTEKGSDLLFETLSSLAGDRPFLLTVGQPRHLHDTFDSAEMGYVTDPRLMAICYSAADVFVLPSLAENQSLVLLEAVACGTPCICFDVGGCREIVKSDQTGFLVKHTDASELGEAIRSFIALPKDDVDRLREGCGKLALAFDWERHIGRYLDLLIDVAEHHKR